MMHLPQRLPEDQDKERTASRIKNFIRRDNFVGTEEGMNLLIKLNCSMYNEDEESFDIKQLQAMLEDSQSDTSSHSQDESDSEVEDSEESLSLIKFI